jgi:NAD(P)-dependent dehydrogenase (short-subunit alcohol dehydrogenase family)
MQQERTHVALVTGGASGLGRAAAQALAARGDKVAVADLHRDGALACAQDIAAAGGQAVALAIDVTDDASVAQAFREAEAALGPIDVLVNSAGIMGVAPLLDYPIADWERILAVNVTGTFRCAQRAAAGMAARGYGRIVNLASISGVRAGIGRAAYGTSKAAVIGLTRQLAMELGPLGITANAVAPGPVVTAMTADAYTPETRAAFEAMLPVGRLGTAQEIAEAIVFLASPGAGYINGHILAVDGGYLAAGVSRTGSVSR